MTIPEAWQPSPLAFLQRFGLVLAEREVVCPEPTGNDDDDLCVECRYPLVSHAFVSKLKVPSPAGDGGLPTMMFLYAHVDCARSARSGL